MLGRNQIPKKKVKLLADTVLLAMGCFGLILTGLTLHWQYSWSCKFQDLEKARILKHRFAKTTIALEQYAFNKGHNSTYFVKTNNRNIMYLPRIRIGTYKSDKSLTNAVIISLNLINNYGQQKGY